jgi:ferredoxin-NADP reductase
MLQPWRMGTVIRIENETNSTRRYWIQVNELEKFEFIPGQFVTLDLPIHEKVNKRWRSYSIASWPDDSNIFELVIVLLEGGLGTTYLFNEVNVGSELTLRGPQGVFVLPAVIDRDIFFERRTRGLQNRVCACGVRGNLHDQRTESTGNGRTCAYPRPLLFMWLEEYDR